MKEEINKSETIMKAKGYSLWLMPTGEAYDKLSGLIKRLANEYNAPFFEPHVTLLGEAMQSNEDVLKKAEKLVSGQRPFPITLSTVEYQDFYFRTLFVRAEKTDQLQALHDYAKEVFEMQDIPDYMPHLSLMYGNFPQAVKDKIIETIGRDQAMVFTISAIHLLKTNGEVSAWHKVKEFPLG